MCAWCAFLESKKKLNKQNFRIHQKETNNKVETTMWIKQNDWSVYVKKIQKKPSQHTWSELHRNRIKVCIFIFIFKFIVVATDLEFQFSILFCVACVLVCFRLCECASVQMCVYLHYFIDYQSKLETQPIWSQYFVHNNFLCKEKANDREAAKTKRKNTFWQSNHHLTKKHTHKNEKQIKTLIYQLI